MIGEDCTMVYVLNRDLLPLVGIPTLASKGHHRLKRFLYKGHMGSSFMVLVMPLILTMLREYKDGGTESYERS